MLRMIKFELAKLFHKGIVLGVIAVLLLINISILMGSCFGNTATNVIKPDGAKLTGREAVAYNQSIAARYAGDFTDKTIARIVSDFASEYPKEYADVVSEHRINNLLPTTYQYISSFIPTPDYEKAIEAAQSKGDEIPPLTDHGLISMREIFANFDKPLQCGFWDSWAYFVMGYGSQLISIAVPALIVIVIAVSTVFSGEYSLKTDALILTTRYGKNRQIIAKLLTCIIFATLIVVGLFAMNCVAYGWQFGLDGWNVDIQTDMGLSFFEVLTPMNNLQLIFFALLLAWLAGIFTAGITAALSSVTKTPFSSLIIALAVFILPWILKQTFVERAVRDSLIVFPINAVNTPEVIRMPADTNSIFFGQPFAPLHWIIIVSFAVLILSSIIAYKAFKSHQVTN